MYVLKLSGGTWGNCVAKAELNSPNTDVKHIGMLLGAAVHCMLITAPPTFQLISAPHL